MQSKSGFQNIFLPDEKLFDLIEKYGSPLYIYSEEIFRKSCRDMHDLLPDHNFRISYSAKANSNLELLKIAKEEDLDVDAMSIGEMHLQQLAGFSPEQIFFIPNNVSKEEMQYAIDRNILISADSLSQLETLGQLNPGGEVAFRYNPTIGVGHHEKVVTGGKKSKFGIESSKIPEVKKILDKYNLKLVAINQHLGSLVMDSKNFIIGANQLLDIATQNFPDLKVIDFGGGFGVPYKYNESRLDLSELSQKMSEMIDKFLETYPNKDVMFRCEPGRYVPAESGIIVGTVESVKDSFGINYIGCDIGFNVNMRPVLYDSHHEIAVITKEQENELVTYTVVGNICESGDISGKERLVKRAKPGDLVVMSTAGAYCYSMASNYNSRLRPAEVLIDLQGNDRIIRKADTLEDLTRNFC